MEKPKVNERKWNKSAKGVNCRMSISAQKSLNGKLQVKMKSIRLAKAKIYLQPNKLDPKKYKTHGIIENNMYYEV